MIVVDVVSLGDKNSNVMTIGFAPLTLAILLWYGSGMAENVVGSHSLVNAERSSVMTQREDAGLWVLGVCHSRPDLLTKIVRLRDCWKPRLGQFNKAREGEDLRDRCPARLPCSTTARRFATEGSHADLLLGFGSQVVL